MENRRFALLPALALAVSACGGPGDNVEILDQRSAAWVPQHSNQELTPGQRFGRDDIAPPPAPQMPSEPVGNALLYDMPEGWTEDIGTRNRLINLHPAGNAEAACYVSVLGGDGGGLTANLNRWRQQVGLEKLEASELENLPTVKLLGGDASLLQVEGSFTGMSGGTQDGWALTGAMVSTQQATIFVKMTGPAELLRAEHENFLNFVASVHFGEDLFGEQDEPQDADHDHAEHNHAEDDAETKADSGSENESPFFTANGYRFQVPYAWIDAGPRMMCSLNFRVGKETECFLVVLGGDGGGLTANLDRWQGQLGLEPLTAEQIDALPKADFLGGSAVMLEAVGEFTGMSGETSFDEKTLIGLALMGGDSAYFLKMVGPTKEVATHREAFLDFAAKLEEVE
ncbi:MAG: hypothetical protein O3A95_04760 [Planctomycetota bacterium]|nr:hypothetical protein [Planctomycetota bacterium]MDA1113595.1 hypothetical protein [Planctomycetota bacterium]